MFVSDPTQGYGLYVDWMLGEANAIQESYDNART